MCHKDHKWFYIGLLFAELREGTALPKPPKLLLGHFLSCTGKEELYILPQPCQYSIVVRNSARDWMCHVYGSTSSPSLRKHIHIYVQASPIVLKG